MKKSTFLFLMLFLFQQIVSLCQTNVGGTLTQNTVWNLAGSPYTLTSTVGVFPGVTLTIQPGVQIIGDFDIVIRNGTLLMSGLSGQRIKVQRARILFKDSDLSKSSIKYVDFDHAGVQLGDEWESNQDEIKNSNTLLVKNVTLNNESFCTVQGYLTTAKLKLEASSIDNATIAGFYPFSEPIELEGVNIKNSQIASYVFNLGIKVTNSIAERTVFVTGGTGGTFDYSLDISDSEINNSVFDDNQGGGVIYLNGVNLTETYVNVPFGRLFMSDCTAKVSSSIPVFVDMLDGEIKNSSIEGSNSTTLFRVAGSTNRVSDHGVVFQKMNFKGFGTAIEISDFNQLTISQNNFLSTSNYNLKNNSSKDITAIGNYWGTTNEQTIKDKIYDIYDDINSGLVNYGEFLQSRVPNALPIITWANPADIEYGTALGVTQLNATSSVDGSFLYAPASGSKLNVGNNQRLSVTFTPTDAVNYTSVTKKVIINVNKGTPLIVWPNPSDIVYGTLLGTTQLNATSFVEGTFSYTPAIGTKLNVGGNQSLSVLFTPTDLANYKSSTKQVSINVIKAPQTITFAALANKTFGDAPFTLSGTSSSGLALTYTSSNTAVATVSGNTVNIVGSGFTTITASQSGNNNYNPAVDVAQSLTVNKASQTITFTALSNKTFGDASFTFSGTSSSGLALAYTSSNTAVATVSGNTVTIVGAGTTTITAKQAGNNNYNPAVDVAQSLTVNKASQTITFATLANKTFGDVAFALLGTSSSGLALTYTSSNTAVATVTGNTVTIVGVGTSSITAKQAGNNNYNPAVDVIQSLTVNKASQTITFVALSNKTFGDAPFTLSGTSSSGLALTYTSSNTAVATVSGNTVTIVGAGAATITAKQAGNGNYHAAVDVTQSLTVNKASQTITFTALSSKTFGDAPFTLSATSSSGLAPTYTSSNTAVATVSGNTVTIVGAGIASITASQAGNSNYNAGETSRQLTVNKVLQTITFTALSNKTFGDAPFALSGSSSVGLPVTFASNNTAVATISGNTVTIVGAGIATITAMQVGNTNYNPVETSRQLTVSKANQTITFSALENKIFGEAPFVLQGSSSSGLPLAYSSSNPSVAIVSGNSAIIVGVGITMITASQLGDGNYNGASSQDQSFIVNKADQSITFAALSDKSLSEGSLILSATASSSLPVSFTSNSDKVSITNSTLTFLKAGRVSITASQVGNGNHNAASSVTQSFCIKPAKPTVTISNLNIPTPLLTSSASAGNQWYADGTVIAGATSATFSATKSGNYKVQVIVDDCIGEFSAEQPLVITGIEAIDFPIDLYPNPVSDALTIYFGDLAGKKQVTIFALTGESLVANNTESSSVRIDLANLSKGTYLARIVTDGLVRTKKFVIH